MSKRRKPKTIAQMIKREELLLRRLRAAIAELSELNRTIEKARAGKIKVPSGPGVKHTIAGEGFTKTREFTADEFGDLIPSFGPSK